MTLQLLHSEFPYNCMRKIYFLFYQCMVKFAATTPWEPTYGHSLIFPSWCTPGSGHCHSVYSVVWSAPPLPFLSRYSLHQSHNTPVASFANCIGVPNGKKSSKYNFLILVAASLVCISYCAGGINQYSVLNGMLSGLKETILGNIYLLNIREMRTSWIRSEKYPPPPLSPTLFIQLLLQNVVFFCTWD